MGTTPVAALPYPEPTDSVDVVRDIKALADALDARVIKAGIWTAYQPTWASSGSPQPGVGAGGTLRGRYYQHGYSVTFQMEMIIAAGFLGGTGGAYSWLLPPAHNATAQQGQGVSGRLVHGGKTLPLTGQLTANGPTILNVTDGTGVLLMPGFAWAVGDVLQMWGTYETNAPPSLTALPAPELEEVDA